MFGSVVLDVAIGLALLFLFVSLICAAIREAIETVLNARSADLERGIREMLDDPTGQGATSALYAHPLIYPLYRGDYRPDQLRPQRSVPGAHAGPHMSRRMSLRGRASLPAYIPSRSFARAYLDLQVRGPVGTAGHPAPALTVAARDAPCWPRSTRAATACTRWSMRWRCGSTAAWTASPAGTSAAPR
jgi:hypothetical protein